MLVISRGFLWCIGVVPGVFATLDAALSAGSFDELVARGGPIREANQDGAAARRVRIGCSP